MTQEDFDLLNQKFKVITYNPESKKLYTNAIRDYFVQGENKTTAVLIVGPPKIKAISLLELRMVIRVSSREFETTVEKTLETQQLDDETIGILWEVGKEETSVPGNLSVSLIGYGGSEEVIKITSDGIVVKADDLEEQAPPESTWNQILSQVQSFATQAAQSKNAAKESEQIATEKAAEATASAATAAQKATEAISAAATAAQEAATLAAAETEEKIRGFADDRYARALVTTEGQAESLTIYPDEGSNISITSHGYTEQSGSGEPSPTNVRPIKVGGKKLGTYTINGTESFRKNGIAFVMDTILPGIRASDDAVGTGGLLSSYLKSLNQGSTYTGYQGISYTQVGYKNLQFYVNGVTAISQLKGIFTEKPLIVWYEVEDESQATGIYTPIITEGESYHCNCIEIQQHLCEGDTVNGNVLYEGKQQCVEKYTKKMVILTGDEDYTETIPSYGAEGTRQFVTSAAPAKDSTVCICSVYKGISNRSNAELRTAGTVTVSLAGNIVFYTSEAYTADSIKAEVKKLYNDGTPVQVVYELAEPVTYAQPLIRMEADPKAVDSSVKVTGEKTVSATYNKSLKKAIEELQAAMLALGANLSI